jgi:hypothetical protein
VSSQDLEGLTPEEEFTVVKLDVSYFHVFGCLVCIRVPEEKRTKFKPSTIKGIFVGYSEISKAYRVYLLTQ